MIQRAQSYASVFQRNARLYLLNSILVGLSYSVFALLFNLYILARGYPKDFLGLLSALPSAVALVAAVPMGMLSDRIGHRLIAETVAWAQGRGLPGVMLETQNINVAARRLYASCGFILGGLHACLYHVVMPGTREIALLLYLLF